jgi:hypothetical protein
LKLNKNTGAMYNKNIFWHDAHTIYDMKELKPTLKEVSHTLQNAKDAEQKEPCKAYANPYLERGKL